MGQPVIYRARYLVPIETSPLEDGAILVDDGHISVVDTFANLSAVHPEVNVVDFGDRIILPPFVNAHTHLELSSIQEWAKAAGEPGPPKEFVDWILWLVRVKRMASKAQIKASLAKGLQSLLCAGTGAVGDICTTLDVAAEYQHSPLFGRVFAEVLGQNEELVAERLATIAELVHRKPGRLLEWALSPHAPYTLSQRTLDDVFSFAMQNKLQSCMHIAESTAESDFLQDGSGAIADKLYSAAKWQVDVDSIPGCSPVRDLCRLGRLQPGDMLVHGVEVDDEDIRLIREMNCSVVLCPRSNAALNGGRAPVTAYLQAGVTLALGTDSLASCPTLSIWDELAFAREWFGDVVSPRNWLEIATSGGATALGLAGRMGRLAPGYDASFQVVALPDMPVLEDLEDALCGSGQKARVSHLFLAARNLLPEG
jgi:cytosine/adenosine deaminase-related metal-dependent hydrolase